MSILGSGTKSYLQSFKEKRGTTQKKAPAPGRGGSWVLAIAGLFSFSLNASTLGLLIMVVVFHQLSLGLPSVNALDQVQLNQPMRVYSSDHDLIAEFGVQRRQPMRTSEAPSMLVKAILAAEDDGFYGHIGFDLVGFMRAMLINFRTGDYNQGASTITMQVARNYFLTPEKSYKRKLREILLAIRMEQLWSKEQILDHYLNKIFLGNRSYGFRSAAKLYYGKTPDDLSLNEIATLAGIPKAPSRDNPWANIDNARERRNYVLRRLYDTKEIDAAVYNRAANEPMSYTRPVTKTEFSGDFVAEMARQRAFEMFGEQAYTAGYSVYTTVDTSFQKAAEASLNQGLINYDRRHGFRGPVASFSSLEYDFNYPDTVRDILKQHQPFGQHQPAIVIDAAPDVLELVLMDFSKVSIEKEQASWAVPYITENRTGRHKGAFNSWLETGDVVYTRSIQNGVWELSQIPEVEGAFLMLDPNSGAIKAMVGGRDFGTGKFNHVLQARRQPGSTIKPYIFSAALEHDLDTASLVSGGPIVLDDPSFQQLWIPNNYDNKFYGLIRLRYALAFSINLVAVRLLQSLGVDEVVDYMKHFGLEDEHIHKGLSMALGASVFTPLEVTRSYATFANGGHLIDPYLIDHIRDSSGNIVYRANPPSVRNFGAAVRHGYEASVREVNAFANAPRKISYENSFLISSMLRDVINYGTAKSATKVLAREDLSGKTGTTNDFRDAWFVGYNQDFVATAWVGFDDQKTLGNKESGSKAALPIWTDFMARIQERIPASDWKKPDNVTAIYVSRNSGKPVAPDRPDAYEEYFVTHRAPVPVAEELEQIGSESPNIVRPQEQSIDISEGLF